MKEPIRNMNWKLLKEQKLDLLTVIDENTNVKINNSLQGILNMIDTIQDYAVDVLGVPENDVFNLEKE